MRAKISINKTNRKQVPYDYQYALASMLYHKLAGANILLANEMHSHTGFKFYTFSNLVLDDKERSNGGLQFRNAHVILSSPDAKFIRSFAEGLLQKPEFHIGGAEMTVDRIEMLPPFELGDTCTMKTLSPIYLKTMRKINGTLQAWDLYPQDGKFYENLHNNLSARYGEYHGTPLEDDYFEVIKLTNFKPKRIKIADSHRRCSLATLEISANPKLIEFAYDAGLGEKNAMGFGCVEVVK